jgi:hypothetical protein
VLGEPLLQKFAWAIPDEKALRILQQFSPIIEMGAGRGYWSHLLQQQGVDITPYDIHPFPPPSASSDGGIEEEEEKNIAWTTVRKGDPSILLQNNNSKKNKKKKDRAESASSSSSPALFLCYPDEGSSVGIECLNNILTTAPDSRDPFCRYLIHVGELIHTGCASGSPQAPWGRSSSPDFQVTSAGRTTASLIRPFSLFPISLAPSVSAGEAQ